MARLNTRVSVSAPDEINVSLVRADYMHTSNVFRVFFEVFLSIGSTLVGVVLSIAEPSLLHWAFLAVVGLAALSFLVLSVRFASKAHSGNGNARPEQSG